MTNDEYLSRTFKALAHPRRAMIFRLLTEAPDHAATFGAIQALTGLGDTALIHHLREMERCGLLARKRIGVHAHYALTPALMLRVTDLARRMVTRPPEAQAA